MVKETGQMEINASEFKARCLALLDRVRLEGITAVIRKRGKIVAKLVAEIDSEEEKPWLVLRGESHFTGDPFAPAVRNLVS